MKGLSYRALVIGLLNTTLILTSVYSTPKQRIVVNPNPRHYTLCRPVLSCEPKAVIANDLTHEGITIEMRDTNEQNSHERVTITYGLPSRPCHSEERSKDYLKIISM